MGTATVDDRWAIPTATRSEIRMAIAEQTVLTHFRRTVTERGGEVALRWRDGEDFASWTWHEYADRACRVAAGLRAAGLQRGERVLLMLRNQPEFHLSDTGVMLAGGTPISIYNSSAPAQVAYLGRHSEAVGIIVAAELFPAVEAALPELPNVRIVVVVGGAEGHRDFAELLATDPLDFATAVEAVRPDDLATVIYTSGTTGQPKGVLIRHRNICASLESWGRALGESMAGWRFISYLPMAHVAERTLYSHYCHLIEGTDVTDCPDPALFNTYLQWVRPDFVYVPPRLLEKMHAQIHQQSAGDPAAQDRLREALELGARMTALRMAGEEPDAELSAGWDRVQAETVDPIRTDLGLDRCRVLQTGAAPISATIFDFFFALGLPLSECYGLSEATGPTCWSAHRPRPGTVGPPIPGVEMRLADDGEILVRSNNVADGYLNSPAETALAFDADGWLHTGDIGEWDDVGYLRIVDRKKDLIITSGGHNVSPVFLESALIGTSLIGQACAIGDRRPYVTALVVLDTAAARGWAAAQGLAELPPAELAEHPELRARIDADVATVNALVARPEQIKRVHVLTDEWLADSTELTATMKLRRRGIHDKYAAAIEDMYEAGRDYIR